MLGAQLLPAAGSVGQGLAMRHAAKKAQQSLQEAVQGMQMAAQSVEDGLILHGAVAANALSEAWVMSVRDLLAASKTVSSAHTEACSDLKHGMMGFGLHTFQMLRLPLALALAGFLLLVCNEVYKTGGLGRAAGGAGMGLVCVITVVFALIVAEYVRLRGEQFQALQKEATSQRIAQEKEDNIQACHQHMQQVSQLISEALKKIDEANVISVYDGTQTANYWNDTNLRGRQKLLQQHLQEAKGKLVMARGLGGNNE